MSNAAIKAALDSSVESASDLLVLVLLADHLNGKTGLCCPSIPLLAEECRCSERSIFRSLKRLEEQGHISRDSGRGVGHSNRYRIHPQGRRKKRAKPEPDSPSDEEQNLTPVSPFEDGEKVTESTPKPDASVTQKVTELVSKPDTSVTLTGSNQNLTGKEPEAAPIESAIASSLFDSPPSSLFDDDDSLLIPIVSSEKKKKNGAQKEKVWEPDEYQKVINGWFERRERTRWSEKELKAYRELGSETIKDGIEDLNDYYSDNSRFAKYKRKSILTLLNNWVTDMDKWVDWLEQKKEIQKEEAKSKPSANGGF